jgi:hypothetical protein
MRRLIGRAWSSWLELAHYVGDFQARMLLTVFYFTLALPFGALVRLLMDPLRRRRPPSGSAWVPRRPSDVSLDAAQRPF